MMTTRTEKQMLLIATRLRTAVYEDFLVKTANPAFMAAARMILPSLRTLGPKIIEKLLPILKSPEFWSTVGPMLLDMVSGKSESDGKDKKEVAASVYDRVVAASILSGTSVSDAGTVAKIVVLAALETKTGHRRKANKDVVSAMRMIDKMRRELKVIKEHV